MLSNKGDPTELIPKIKMLLGSLGKDRSTAQSVAYDTAWMARLSEKYASRSQFYSALNWLRKNQHLDGSWGGEIFHYHDRTVSTLAVLIALKQCGELHRDRKLIEKGEAFLWNQVGRLPAPTIETSEFPFLLFSLTAEAYEQDLDIPQALNFLEAMQIEQRLESIGLDPQSWLKSKLGFAYESFYGYVHPNTRFLASNGSINSSPSSTVAFVLKSANEHPQVLDYLVKTMSQNEDGGVPFANPADIFEATQTLNILRMANVITPNNLLVKKVLEFLWSVWNPEIGVGFSSQFLVPDLASTALTYTLLKWAGYHVSADVFTLFEEETYFRSSSESYELSLSANLYTLIALGMDLTSTRFEDWKDKIVNLFIDHDSSGYCWVDNQHISPFYLTYLAIIFLMDIDNNRLHLQTKIRWMLKSQQKNGGWGFYDIATAEETSYCLLALLFWDEYARKIDPEVIHSAGRFLKIHSHNSTQPALWVSKSLFTPTHVVNVAIIAALTRYQRYCISN